MNYCILHAQKIHFKLTFLKLAIDEFMSFFRVIWPAASIPPKIHMLEKHVLPFMRQWKTGCGFYGEQGGESIHQVFKKIKGQFNPIKNAVARVRYMMEEHLRMISPEAVKLKPSAKKRKFKTEQ